MDPKAKARELLSRYEEYARAMPHPPPKDRLTVEDFLVSAIAEVVAEEREACAKVAEDWGQSRNAALIAKDIRERR